MASEGVKRVEKYTLLIDMDSVIVDLMGKWFGAYNADYDDHLTVDQLTTWNSHELVKPACGAKIYDYLDRPGFYRDLKPLPHAIEVLQRLHECYEIYIVTASPVSALQDKAAWVEEHLPFIGVKKIIFAHDKDCVVGDLLFDDAPHNLQKYIDKGRLAVAMDYPYNKDLKCRRVSNWLEFESSLAAWLKES